jgi:hypothetical protein
MSGEHFIKKCKYCGTVMSQCRCPGEKRLELGVCQNCEDKNGVTVTHGSSERPTGYFDYYIHLSEKGNINIPMNIDTLARQIVEMNYGVHRFVCALVKAAEVANVKCYKHELIAALRKAVETYTI